MKAEFLCVIIFLVGVGAENGQENVVNSLGRNTSNHSHSKTDESKSLYSAIISGNSNNKSVD